jgi:hypothetical protein
MTRQEIDEMIIETGKHRYSTNADQLAAQQIIATLEIAFQLTLVNEKLDRFRFTSSGNLRTNA